MNGKSHQLYRVPKSGNGTQVKKLTMMGSVVGLAYDKDINVIYAVGFQTTGSTLYKIDAATFQILSSRSDLGRIRSSPLIDKNGDLYVGNEQGLVYSLDSSLNVRTNYPFFAGSSITTNLSMSDDGLLFVGTGNSAAVYKTSGRPDGGKSGAGEAKRR